MNNIIRVFNRLNNICGWKCAKLQSEIITNKKQKHERKTCIAFMG